MFEFNWGVFWAILAAFAAVDVIRWLYNRLLMMWLASEGAKRGPIPLNARGEAILQQLAEKRAALEKQK